VAKSYKGKKIVNRKGFSKKINDKSFICNKTKHWAKDSKERLDKRTLKREGLLKPISLRLITSLIIFLETNLFIIIFKVNLINNLEQWLVGISATKHVCDNKMMFSTYKEVDGKYLYSENSLTFNILGVGKGILKITFKKLITFNNVLYVANFDLLLRKISFKMVFEIDKFILSKNDMFIKEKKKKNVFVMAFLR